MNTKTFPLSSRSMRTIWVSAALLSLMSYTLPATTVNCDSPGQSLQQAIDTANTGSVLSIRGNCDDGPFDIRRKNLSLIADGPATLSSPAGKCCVVGIGDGSSVLIHGLTIDAAGTNTGMLLDSSPVELREVTVKNAGNAGIRAGFNTKIEIRDSDISDNGRVGVFVAENSSAFLVGNTIQRNVGSGVEVVFNGSGIFEHNLITDSQNGILLTRMSSLLLVGNTIENNSIRGLWVGSQYGYLSTFGSGAQNTVQNNGVDVVCDARGIFQLGQPLISSSQTSVINPSCTVTGTLF